MVNTDINVQNLPEQWTQTSLEKVAVWGSGGTPPRKRGDYFQGDIPWIKTGELGKQYIRDTEEKITEEAINNSSAKIFPKGSVAIAMYGATIGKTSILGIDASSNQACAIAQPIEDLLFNKYLYFYLLNQGQKFIDLGKGGAQPNISQTIIKSYPIPIPPPSEQRRIVDKIEELFSDLDSGIASLKTAQQQLKVYRQAVLKWAFEGKLTAEWREEQQRRGTLESAETLLAQIKVERERRYEEAIATWKTDVKTWEEHGKPGKKPRKPSKVKTISQSLDDQDLYQAPISWIWIFHSELLEKIEAGKSFRCDERPPKEEEIGVAKVSAVTWGEYDEFESKTCLDETKINSDFIIRPNEFLFSRANTIQLVGACVITKKCSLKVMLSDKTLRFLYSPFIEKKYALYYLRSTYGRSEIENLSTGNQESMRNIGQNRIRNIRFPLPNFIEQKLIVEEIESRLSICDKLEADIETNLKKAEALRQSILKQAFEGKLVPQDPEEEPASVLLERIRGAR